MNGARPVSDGQREAIIARARETFLRHERVEMNELAEHAGVNRNTLFRWFGGRDRILGEVIWSITEPTLDRCAQRAKGTGAVRIANVMGDFAAAANRGKAFVPFVRSEPQRAMRVMTTRAGGVHGRILDWIVSLVDAEIEAGRFRPELPVHDLAYLLLRTAEAFVYSPVITGEEPDAEKVRMAAAALLGVASEFVDPAPRAGDGAAGGAPSSRPEEAEPGALPEQHSSVQERVRCSVEGGVADVRLARAEKLNALDDAMFEALIATGQRLAADPSVRVVVLSGEGRAFSAGIEFDRLRQMRDGFQHAPSARGPIGPASATAQQAAHVWTTLPVPVVAAVHGVAFGGGLRIALGADVRIVHPSTELSLMEVKGGIVPDMTGTQLLDGLVRRDVAKELIYTGRIIDGTEAVQIGLATRCSDDPHGAAVELAREIASKNPFALRRSKVLTELAGRVSLADGSAEEQAAIASLIGTANQSEAVSANSEDRAPTFADPPTA
ncbi:crotonase/enoyl-CoA hydratase family protein [Tsukamurella asaccharolytica]|uniref:crotonase/enoyl-CoA hydratase family protein n=1 Tax=Tsukamurella asaccharolytica TaxID=2592067 RepID=UPI00131597E1|nr:crotonase/enoyl-CoA hydratase family protein [Tsukamurella asaccharolytica]